MPYLISNITNIYIMAGNYVFRISEKNIHLFFIIFTALYIFSIILIPTLIQKIFPEILSVYTGFLIFMISAPAYGIYVIKAINEMDRRFGGKDG